MKYLFLLMAQSVLFISCSKVDRMQNTTEDMKKTTEEMSVNTQSMSQTTGDMAKTTADMAKTTADMAKTTQEMSEITKHMDSNMSTMYHQVRIKETEETRHRNAFDDIFNKTADMGNKLASASVYFQAFEFQYWANDPSYDNQHMREMLFLDAVNEFYRRTAFLYDFIKDRHIEMSPLHLNPNDNNEEMAIHALAAAMHFINHYQEDAAADSGFITTSFYDLLKSSLTKLASGEPHKDYEGVPVTGQNLEFTKMLLNARFNMMIALAMKNATSKDRLDFGQTVDAGLFQMTNGGMGKLRLENVFDRSNEATKTDIIAKLEGAIKVKKFVDQLNTLPNAKEVNLELKMDKSLKSVINNLSLTDLNRNKDATQKNKDFNKSFNDYIGLLKK